MSVVTLGETASSLTSEEVTILASTAGLKLQDEHIKDWTVLLGSLDQSIESIMAHKDYTLQINLDNYPRTDIHTPIDSDKGGWAIRCMARCTIPKTGELEGKTIALKDNVALAGVICTNGTLARTWTPEIDATIATRIMDAAGTITGKAACENACMEGVSDTSCTGNVHNPYADDYSCGGSSSGSGRLVSTGSVDMAIGGDQGGSIRIPASMCGIVGLKPTWGLVPYTGILSLECTIDHCGPMSRTVRDAALLLDVIAGSDGIDDRQPPFLPAAMMDYTAKLDTFLSSWSSTKPLGGISIGVLDEGFTIPGMEPTISALCYRAVDHLAILGAKIKRISIPWHTDAAIVWMCSLPMAGAKQGLLGDMEGRKQLFLTDRPPLEQLSQTAFDALGPGGQNLYMRYLYLKQKYGPALHAKCTNLLRKINDNYDIALSSVDVLVMPTLPSPPCKLFADPTAHGPLERLSRNVGLVGNTAPFNSTGHPALTIPVGFVPALEDPSIKLPAGLQIVAKKFHEIDCFKVGAAWEHSSDWKTF